MEFPSEDISKKEAVVGGPQAKQASWRSNFLSGLNAAQDYRKANLKAMAGRGAQNHCAAKNLAPNMKTQTNLHSSRDTSHH